MKFPSLIVAVFFAAVVVYGQTSFDFYREQIEQLSRNATFQLQLKREAHRIAVSQLTNGSLVRIGTSTAHGRRRTAEALEFIDSFNGALSEEEEACLEEAYGAQREYAQVLDDDLSHCASKVYNETTVEALEEFRDVAGPVQLAAFLALNQAMVAFEVEDSEEGRERYLREELEFWNTLWELYSSLLDRKLDEQGSHREEVIQSVGMCLEQALFFFDYTIEYVKANLEKCFAK